MEHLYEKLTENARSDVYPYHMPGHKRRVWGRLSGELFPMDITETEGFDNLHCPEGILLSLQKRAAELYGAEESFYLINGSTCGVLAAVSGLVSFGGHILMACNCHKSAYHAAYLRHLEISRLWPPVRTEYDIFDAVTPGQVREALEREPGAEAVLIVSPTYEGRIADVRAIAEIVHERGIPLIVDEAHGAHLGLAEGFPENSCRAGADVVIHSVHKTLPALTQTALLHVNGALADRERIRRFLRIYQSSSPSYLLMAGIDNALQYVEEQGKEAFARFKERYGRMTEALSLCRHLDILTGESKEQDVGKLLISVKRTALTGKQLYDILLQKYRLQTEMASESFVLAMFTVGDDEEGYRRMTEALLEIDGTLSEASREADAGKWEGSGEKCERHAEILKDPGGPGKARKDCIPLWKAWDMAGEELPLSESVGRYAGEFINLYPPGVPLLIPGERMTEELCGYIRQAAMQGLTVQGVREEEADSGEERFFVKMLTEKYQ